MQGWRVGSDLLTREFPTLRHWLWALQKTSAPGLESSKMQGWQVGRDLLAREFPTLRHWLWALLED